MKLTLLVAACYALLGPAVALDHMQINFYSDWSCTKYIGEIPGGWATPMNNVNAVAGINYRYGTSLNIAACAHGYCACRFYPEENRQGTPSMTLVYGMGNWGNCIRTAQNFKSYSCFYY